jgi:hypothetical protein
LEAVFAEHVSYATAMALTAASVFGCAALIAGFGREKKGIEFGAALQPITSGSST